MKGSSSPAGLGLGLGVPSGRDEGFGSLGWFGSVGGEAAAEGEETSVGLGVVVGEDPAAELNRFVDKWGGDVLVVGTSARTGLNRVLVGSIAERLFLHARVPVLVIGPAAAV